MGLFRGSETDQRSPQRPERFVVVDVETTGVYNSDRVVEIAAVTLSSHGEVIDEWDTLVDPGRDVGPTYIHGVTASMVSLAPRFEEAASALADRLHGAVLVGHNLPFDSRMLAMEYARLGAQFNPGRGICTLSRCGGRLEVACAEYGIDIEHHHRALADARATAQLFLAVQCNSDECMAATLAGLPNVAFPRTFRRDVVSEGLQEMPFLAGLAARTSHRQACGASLVYLDLLDRALNDLRVTADEWHELCSVARSLGMTTEDIDRSHECYMRELIAAATRDGRITEAERVLLERASTALRLDERIVGDALVRYRTTEASVRFEAGISVCFTGAATYSDGTELTRADLSRKAQAYGMRVSDSVTKKSCDLLVAADPSSQSGKVRKARQFSIPVVSVEDFLYAQPGSDVPAH